MPFVNAIHGVFAYSRLATRTNAGQTFNQQSFQTPGTSVARRGTITLSAIGTGTLQPADQVQLGFGGNTSGKLVTLNVKVGDSVKAGQLLAEIDNSQAKINYQQAQQSYLSLSSPAAIAQAQQAFAAAQATLNTDINRLIYIISPDQYYWQQQLAAAQQALAAAKAAGGASPTTAQQQAIDDAQAKVNYAQDSLTGAHVRWLKTYVPTHFTSVTRTINSRTRKATVTKQVAIPTDAEIAAAQAAVSYFRHRIGGLGGVICAAPDGRVGFAYSTRNMAYACRTAGMADILSEMGTPEKRKEHGTEAS